MDTKTIVKQAGGVVKVGAALGLSPSSVSVWRLVPPRHVRTVARLSGIPEHVIRPDIFGPPDGVPVEPPRPSRGPSGAEAQREKEAA